MSTTDASVVVPRDKVTLGTVPPLLPDDAVDVQITIASVSRPGSYTGEVEIYAAGRRSEGVTLPLTLVVSQVPDPTDSIQVEPSPLKIEARIGVEASFSETLILNSSGGTIAGFQAIADRLTTDDGEVTLPRSAVELVGGSRELPSEQYVPVELKVKGVTRPGLYSGDVLFIPRGQRRERGTRLTVILDAKGVPALTPVPESGSDKATLKISGCDWCGVEQRWLGSSEARETVLLDFDTPPRVPVTITSTTVIARGEKTQRPLRPGQVEVSWGIASQNLITAVIKADRDAISPDRYTGRLRLTLDDADAPVFVPLTVTVKDGPLRAFGAILLGILAAWIFRSWTRQNDRWRAQEAIDRVLERAQTEAPDDWRRVVPALDRARQAADRGEAEVAAETLKAVGKRIDVLVATRTIQASYPQHATALEEVRRLVEAELDEDAAAALAEIRREIRPREDVAPASEAELQMAGTLMTSIGAIDEALGHLQKADAARSSSASLRRTVAYYVGGTSDWAAATSRNALAAAGRFLVGLAIVVVAAVVALQTQYVAGSDTFGVDPFWDYFALVVAGFTGGLSQKPLASAKPAKP